MKKALVQDSAYGDILLEQIEHTYYDIQWPVPSAWFPEWSKMRHAQRSTRLVFFQSPLSNVRHTNLLAAGILNWPKRFLVKRVQLSVSMPRHGLSQSFTQALPKAAFQLRVGEKVRFEMPLVIQDDRSDDAQARYHWEWDVGGLNGEASETSGIFIPPVLNFLPSVESEAEFCESEWVLQLTGTLQREIA